MRTRADVREHMSGVSKQRERGRDKAKRYLEEHEADEQRQRDQQIAAVGVSRKAVVAAIRVIVAVMLPRAAPCLRGRRAARPCPLRRSSP